MMLCAGGEGKAGGCQASYKFNPDKATGHCSSLELIQKDLFHLYYFNLATSLSNQPRWKGIDQTMTASFLVLL